MKEWLAAEWLPPQADFTSGTCGPAVDVYSAGYLLLCILLKSPQPKWQVQERAQLCKCVGDEAHRVYARVSADVMGPLVQLCAQCMGESRARPSVWEVITGLNLALDALTLA